MIGQYCATKREALSEIAQLPSADHRLGEGYYSSYQQNEDVEQVIRLRWKGDIQVESGQILPYK